MSFKILEIFLKIKKILTTATTLFTLSTSIAHASNFVAVIQSQNNIDYEIAEPFIPEPPGVIDHPTGTNQILNITKSMLYYDNGGASGTYTGFNIAELQMIPPVGYVIKAEVLSFSMNGNDTVHIASGDNAYYSPTGSNWSCQYAVCVGQSFTSTATDGSMSFAYGSGAIVADGWEILITLVEN